MVDKLDSINSFRAAYCSGLLIRNQSTLAALCLLFEKVYLPNNIEFILEFSRKHTISINSEKYKEIRITPESGDVDNPLDKLSERQKETFFKYLSICLDMSYSNSSLFDDVIETNAFSELKPVDVRLKKIGKNGEKNTYEVIRNNLQLVSDDEHSLPNLIERGYIPVVGGSLGNSKFPVENQATAKQLAAILATKSVEMFFPATCSARDEDILEARHKLRDHLPLFWSSMFKLSIDMKKAIQDCKTADEVFRVGQDIVDTTVRPALTDLNRKVELERKQWFFRIFGRVYSGLKVAASNPPLTPDQLIRRSLMFGVDTIMDFAGHQQKIESLRDEGGLTYLLELGSIRSKI